MMRFGLKLKPKDGQMRRYYFSLRGGQNIDDSGGLAFETDLDAFHAARRLATEHPVPRHPRAVPRDETPDLAAADPVDHAQIEMLRSLDDGAGAVLGEIIDQYLTQVADGREELQRVFDQGDAAAVQRAAHTLKGASSNVGATALAAVPAPKTFDADDQIVR